MARRCGAGRDFFNEFLLAHEAARTIGREKGRDLRILYVEDDDVMAKSVGLMLRAEGHSCDTTAYGKRAVMLGRCHDYDVILLDIMLPDIDGYEVIKQLREVGVDTPFLVQSGLVARDQAMDGRGFGVAEYLVKPFNKKELVERLNAVVTRAQERRDAAPPPEEERRDTAREDAPEDRREHRRFKTIKGGKITFRSRAEGLRSVECFVVSLSDGGAALQLRDAGEDIPPSFAIELQGNMIHQCDVCWRFRDKLGVKFV